MANDTVLLEYLAAVADLDSAAQYDWGSAILASLYYGLDTVVTTGGSITGFVQLRTYWFCEYCGVGHPIVKEEFVSEAEGPDPGWHMEWTGRRERLLIARLRDLLPMSSSYGAEELWYLTHGMRRLVLAESEQDAQRLQEVDDELVIAHRQIDSINHQLYAHDLQLRRGSDVRVVPLLPVGSARTRQRGSGPQTRGGGTSRRGRGTGEDSE
ncbi:hypothetical protein GIB67_023640 [Kingdonia uniflora]|uniref:Uncharacterized protein n=1 Tax=Kingdonia uniflora TaxID=39325 RepID=A0A7J7L513_9MAGN|nr:hypothetical protein GIB67_023640 [Kingdonia uniflora]